jgi:hypothetical protein
VHWVPLIRETTEEPLNLAQAAGVVVQVQLVVMRQPLLPVAMEATVFLHPLTVLQPQGPVGVVVVR